MHFPFAEVGMGEFLLALIPTINLIALAFIYKFTGRVGNELTGQTAEVKKSVHEAKQEIRDDLKNGIRGEVEEVVDTMKNQVIPRLDHKRERLDTIEKQLKELQEKKEAA